MHGGNGPSRIPVAIVARHFAAPGPGPAAERRRSRRSALLAGALFLVTGLSTLAVGTEFALAYAEGRAPFSQGFDFYLRIAEDPARLALGVPFSFTLLGILLAHELGHYFACRYYGIRSSYPYFIPAPSLIGTLGAFIRIRSPIVHRRALFDVGLAGPVVGFLFAVPALAAAVAYSKVIPAAQVDSPIHFGSPPLVWLLAGLLRPGVPVEDIFLHPVGRAAWVGLFATALNLLPIGQLDGGHVVYALASEQHRRLSIAAAIVLVPMGWLFWEGWYVWAVLPLLLGLRHPQLLDRGAPLDARRRAWALIAVLIFLLCFTPQPLESALEP